MSRVCPAWAIIRARARVIGPVKLGPRVGASSAGGSVGAPGRSRGLKLLDFLVVGPCLDRLVLYRERDASIDCLGSRMQSLFHQAFSFEAAVVNSLGVFKVEAVTCFSCVHPDERGGLYSPDCSLMFTYSALQGERTS